MIQLSILQVIFLALIQGSTELFPVSSLGHTVVFPALIGWGDLVRNENFLPLIVALHLGTSIALVIYFWKDWMELIKTIFLSVQKGEIQSNSNEWIGWLIIIGCIPAGLLGIFLESPLKQLFATPPIAAGFLIINGCILFFGEYVKKNSNKEYRQLSSLTWKDAILIGLAQSCALIPGISRSGITMVAGLKLNLNHEDAARYSFLLGTPIIAAAALLEVPKLFGLNTQSLVMILFGMIISGIGAYLSVKFLLKYFENNNLKPFAYYCWIIGIASLSILWFMH